MQKKQSAMNGLFTLIKKSLIKPVNDIMKLFLLNLKLILYKSVKLFLSLKLQRC